MANYLKIFGFTSLAMTMLACHATGTETENNHGLSVESVPQAVSEGKDMSNANLGPGAQRLADLAIADMSSRFKIEKEDIKIVRAEYVTWRDSSAGCPRPDMQYLQVLTSGSRIVLKAGDKIYHYHSGGSRPPFYCAKPSPQKPLPYSHGEA